MASIQIKYEKCAYSVYLNGRLIRTTSRHGVNRAKDYAEVMQKALMQFGIVSEIECDETELTKRRFYGNFSEVYFGEKNQTHN